MKIINRAELDVQEIEHLKAIAQINCDGIECRNCQLRIVVYGRHEDCTRDLARMCLTQNNINFDKERS